MALLQELIDKIEDPVLRGRIAEEVRKTTKNKKFGLVFEEHLPECTPLYDIPVKEGSLVALKGKTISDSFIVKSINNGKASCIKKDTQDIKEFDVDSLVSIAEFGEPIYPYLKPIDSVENAPDSELWHTLIEADNYHALQLLEYLYAGKVDCIYIDPPYNTGARDWKYNNDYVDNNDAYRHSKWLSMMEKRLKLAEKLLNPKDSVLIVTIDEKEYLHLGCLLEELFPYTNIQMISSVIARNATARKNLFSRSNEFIYIVEFGNAAVQPLPLSDEWRTNAEDKRGIKLRWADLIRCGDDGIREYSPSCFYPILVSEDGKRFLGAGDPLPLGVNRNTYMPPEGAIPIWPLHSDGTEGRWGYSKENLIKLQAKGFVKLGNLKNGRMRITMLTKGEAKKVEDGVFPIEGYNEDGSIICNNEVRMITPTTQWSILSHNARTGGTELLQGMLGTRFSYPKSLYAVHDVIRFFVDNKPNALILDFFAGSGTTLHAVNLLNAEDGGNRRCIIVTNNEVSEAERKEFTKLGIQEGTEEWESKGIARYVTWPRTVCSIEGHDVNGKPLKGDYITTCEEEIHMSDGFRSNCEYFKLGFLNKTEVALGKQFSELVPILWMKAGAIGRCPVVERKTVPSMMVLPKNKLAVLTNESKFMEFYQKLEENPEIQTVFIVTDSESSYNEMISILNVKTTYQLYRDYLDNFKINTGRV